MKGRVWFHRTSAIVWAALIVPALIWWPDSVAFVIAASVYANVKSDWGAAEAADDREVLDRLDQINSRLRRIEIQLQDPDITQDMAPLLRRLPPGPYPMP